MIVNLFAFHAPVLYALIICNLNKQANSRINISTTIFISPNDLGLNELSK